MHLQAPIKEPMSKPDVPVVDSKNTIPRKRPRPGLIHSELPRRRCVVVRGRRLTKIRQLHASRHAVVFLARWGLDMVIVKQFIVDGTGEAETRVLQTLEAARAQTVALSGESGSYQHVVRLLAVQRNLLIFEYAEHGEMFGVVHELGALDEMVCLYWIQQAASGLAAIHGKKMCHLDVSLENIVLDRHDKVQLCDFGLAQNCMVQQGERMGKAQYMAPEMWVPGGALDGRCCDVFSLGVCFFTMLFGIPPFAAAQERDLRWVYIATGRTALLSLLDSWGRSRPVDDQTLDLLMCMLHESPAQRILVSDILRHPALSNLA
jgi:serine/threonine protein kinase